MSSKSSRYLNQHDLEELNKGSITVAGPLLINFNQDQAVSENTKISPALKNGCHQQDCKFDKRR